MLKTTGLTKVYADGVTALNGIDFEMSNGEFVVIIGPSGAGKSTFLRSINLLAPPTAGKVVFNGTDLTSVKQRNLKRYRRKIGMIFQDYNLISRLLVLNNVLHGRLAHMNTLKSMFSLFSQEDKEHAMSLLKRVGLEEQMYKRADELSGGQQQRVGIARALAQNPSLILADEPIASLDPKSSEVIMDLLFTICKEEGIACLCNLHQVDVAKKYATRIVGINNGEKVFDGKPSELTDQIVDRIYQAPKTQTVEEKIPILSLEKELNLSER